MRVESAQRFEVFLCVWNPHNPLKGVTAENLITYQFTRVPFGFISSPFLLAATIRHHFTKYDHDITKEIAENIYVDNCLLTAETTQEAIEKYRLSRPIFSIALTYIDEDSSPSSILRPIDFLLSRSSFGMPACDQVYEGKTYRPRITDSQEQLLDAWKNFFGIPPSVLESVVKKLPAQLT